MLFLLDSNVFINAARLYYSPDIAPTFWGWLTEQNRLGRIASVSRVKDEIDDGEMGYLKKWSSELPNTFWLRPGVKAMDIDSMSRLADWTMHPDRPYRDSARAEFLNVADYYLVAQAHSTGAAVVTFELPAPSSRRRVLIPDACRAMGVSYFEPFGVYRRLGLRFS
ncbi:DUF4411 family protein [Actinomyces gerencseriae]|jgi:hypothetical protein|uniref:DUF4411 family protein n=1 Tax=Actinomyces gerencseriae TaxID=52769 RepID=UPI0023F13F7D|nr:DUF4411 family protein [Actinomyces gerencseriae]